MNERMFSEAVAVKQEPTVGDLIKQLENQQEDIQNLIYGIIGRLEGSSVEENNIEKEEVGYVGRLKELVRKNSSITIEYLAKISKML